MKVKSNLVNINRPDQQKLLHEARPHTWPVLHVQYILRITVHVLINSCLTNTSVYFCLIWRENAPHLSCSLGTSPRAKLP